MCFENRRNREGVLGEENNIHILDCDADVVDVCFAPWSRGHRGCHILLGFVISSISLLS